VVCTARMSLDLDPETQLIVDPRDAAESVGLRDVSDDEPGLQRAKQERDFLITKPDGKSVRNKPTRERIRTLERSHPGNGP
jgi:DNA topoisomerase I